jgi:hypothetical protein
MLDHDNDPWLRHLPVLHAVLAGSIAPIGFAPPPPRDSDIFTACAWWEPLRYVIVTLLGWHDIGRGLRWWYDAGLPEDDTRLRVVKALWNDGPALDLFAAWAWNDADNYDRGGTGPTPLQPDIGWWRRLPARGLHWPHDPFHGGMNALHLGHSGEPIAARTIGDSVLQLTWHVPSRRAVLVTSAFAAWKEELAAVEPALPQLNGRSWHVDVFDRHVGWLGTFRRSRVTDVWFAGRHALHMRGQ